MVSADGGVSAGDTANVGGARRSPRAARVQLLQSVLAVTSRYQPLPAVTSFTFGGAGAQLLLEPLLLLARDLCLLHGKLRL